MEFKLNILSRVSTCYISKATETHAMKSPLKYHLIKLECQFGGYVMVGVFIHDSTNSLKKTVL
jgi:hypothetical protein